MYIPRLDYAFLIEILNFRSSNFEFRQLPYSSNDESVSKNKKNIYIYIYFFSASQAGRCIHARPELVLHECVNPGCIFEPSGWVGRQSPLYPTTLVRKLRPLPFLLFNKIKKVRPKLALTLFYFSFNKIKKVKDQLREYIEVGSSYTFVIFILKSKKGKRKLRLGRKLLGNRQGLGGVKYN